MKISYDRLWLRLRERGMTATDLQERAGISSRTVARLRKNEPVRTSTLEKVCSALSCGIADVMDDGTGQLSMAMPASHTGTFKVASFFAGIGGFDLGFERQGFQTDYLCEIEPFCNKVLSRHWPNVARGYDINDINADDIPDVDVWTGGFPCQDISVARGRLGRPGLNGERSGLFFKFAELIAVKKPKVVLLENVAGLLSSNGGRDFKLILDQMTGMGYSVAWRMMNTRYFGAPQSRNRVYICCWLDDTEKALKSMFENLEVPRPKGERKGFITPGVANGTYPMAPQVAYCLAATSGRHTGTDWSRTYVVCQEGVRRMTPVECERLQGFPDLWTMETSDAQDANEDNDTLRYTALGNAVSVPVVEWIASRIRAEIGKSKNHHMTFDSIQLAVPGFEKVVWQHDFLKHLTVVDQEEKLTWKRAGIAVQDSVITADIPASPAQAITSNFAKIVEKKPVASRYYLSPNAAEGIIRRVTKANRSLFQPLHEALEELARLKS